MSAAAALRRIPAVLTRPAAAFAGFTRKDTAWLFPAVLIALLLVLPAQTVLRPLYLDKQQAMMEQLVDRGILTEEKAHEVARAVEEQKARPKPGALLWQTLLGMAIQIALRIVLPAALLLAGAVFVMEARTTFAPMLAVMAYGSLPAGVREIVRAPLQLAKGSLDVYFSPAALTGTQGMGGFALNLLDLFDIWILALVILGVSTVTGMSRGRAAGLVLPLWGFYSLAKIGLKASPLGSWV